MTFDEWWKEQPTRFTAAGFKDDAREIWEAATMAEREACAQLCENDENGFSTEGKWCAAAIRARSNLNSTPPDGA